MLALLVVPSAAAPSGSALVWSRTTEVIFTLGILVILSTLLALLWLYAVGPLALRQRGRSSARTILPLDAPRSDDVAAAVPKGSAEAASEKKSLPSPSDVAIPGWQRVDGVTHYTIEVSHTKGAGSSKISRPARRLSRRLVDFQR